MLRASITAERAGFPAVSLIGSLFEVLAVAASRQLGVDGAPLAVYPGRIKMDDEEEFRRKLETTVTDQIVAGLTTATPVEVGTLTDPRQRDIVFSGTLDAIQDHFEQQLWTDGLPVIPPTIARVEAFLAHTSRDADEVLGILLPEHREATVWNVAVTGVMAGCRPQYMPVLLAAVEAICDPHFRLEDGGSGGGWEPQIIVSGPIINELEFNAGTGAQRIGRRANSAIGRFLRLYIRNVAGQRIPPGEADKGGLGNNFHIVLAEDEATVRSLGWPTHGDDLGVPDGSSAVTVIGVVAESPPFGEHGGPSDDPLTYLEPLVEVFGKAILSHWVWTGMTFDAWDPIVILSPHCATVLAAAGWTKDDVRTYLHGESKVPLSLPLRRGSRYSKVDVAEKVRLGLLPPEFHESDDPDRLISPFIRPEAIRIVVAGNPDMYWQRGIMSNFSHGAPVTRIVEHQDG